MAMCRSVMKLLRNTNRTIAYVGAQHQDLLEDRQKHHTVLNQRHIHPSGDGSQGYHNCFATFPGIQWGHFPFSTQAASSLEEHIEQHPVKTSATAAVSSLSIPEARRLLKLMKIDDFKKLLLSTGNHCMPVEEVLKLCKQTGAATTDAEAEELTKNLDEAGVILIFRKRVFLKPDKVADSLSRTMPIHLASEKDPRVEELARLQREKEEIDRLAHRQVRNMLWGALGAFALQSVVFFRLTFWDLSWDVMEPITFFVTSSSLLAGFFFFVLTHRDPSYHDLMDTLLSNKQRKLMKKKHFNEERFKELQVQCCLPIHENRNYAKH